jgi:thiamine transport system permease protein
MRWIQKSILFIAFAYLGLLLVYPVLHMLSWLPKTLSSTISDIYYYQRLGITWLQGLMTVILCIVISLPLAIGLWCSRLKPDIRGLLLKILLLPFVLPTVIIALAVWGFLGPQGLLAWSSDSSLPLLLYGYVLYNLGLMLWMVYNALLRIPINTLFTARCLGANQYQIFLHLLWPLIKPTVYSISLLIFLFCTTNFGLALLLGGEQWATLEVEIYTLSIHYLALADATFLALLQMLTSFLLLLWYHQYQHNQPLNFVYQYPQLTLSPWLRIICFISLVCTLFIVLGPLVWLICKSFTHGGLGLQLLWGNTEFWLALGNTIKFIAIGLPMALFLGASLAVLTKKQSLLGQVLTYLPYLVSGSLLSLALIITYPGWIDHLLLLIGGYVLLAYPFITRTMSLGLYQLNPTPLQVTQTLGAKPWQAFWHGVWPQIATPTRTGVALAGATMLGEFAITLFFSRPEWITLTTFIYKYSTRIGQTNTLQAQAASVILLCLALLLFYLITSWGKTPKHQKSYSSIQIK